MSAADLRRWWFPSGAGAIVTRAALWVEGPDARSFLQGLVSNNVTGLGDGESCRALLLDAKGHIVAETGVHSDGAQCFTLLCEPHLAEALMDVLERYHFSEDLELFGPERLEALVVRTGTVAPADAEMVVEGQIPGTDEVLVPDPRVLGAALGLWMLDSETLERARIAAGVPRIGHDTGAKTLAHEAGLEAFGVAWGKGCYLGQETVVRTQYRGRVNRLLRVVEFDGPPPPVPSDLHYGERVVGALTSCVALPGGGALGLAIVRREAEPGESVQTADGLSGRLEAVEPFVALGDGNDA